MATASFEIRGRDCAMLRNTMTSERPLSDTLPHPRGSSLSRRIHEEEEDERRGRRQKEMENREKSGKKKSYKPMCGRLFNLSSSCLSAFYFLPLSLFPPSPSFPLHLSLFFSLISLYLSQAECRPVRRMNLFSYTPFDFTDKRFMRESRSVANF